MKIEVQAELSTSAEPTARALMFGLESPRRRREPETLSPSFRHPSGSARSPHGSPQIPSGSPALTASALSALLLPALQQALPSVQVNLDPQQYERTEVNPSLELMKTLLPLQTTEFSDQIRPKMIDLLTNSLSELANRIVNSLRGAELGPDPQFEGR